MGRFKKMFSIVLILSLFITSVVVFKSSEANVSYSRDEKLNRLSYELVNYIEGLSLDEVTPDNIEKFFNHELDKDLRFTTQDLVETIKESNSQIKTLKEKGYSDDEIADLQVIKSVITKNNFRVEFLSNGLFSIENLNNISKSSSRASVWGQAYKDYYDMTGWYMLTMAVGSGFSYNGSRASYYGNFEAYYKRGKYVILDVSNWEKGHESVGTSYRAHASGNFSYGIKYDGNEVIFGEVYLRHQVMCDRNGKITTEYKEVQESRHLLAT